MPLLEVDLGWWAIKRSGGLRGAAFDADGVEYAIDVEREYPGCATVEIADIWDLVNLARRADSVRRGMRGAGHRWIGYAPDGGWLPPWKRIRFNPASPWNNQTCPRD